MLVITILISISLIQSVNTNGWANEKIRSDSLKITADEKYEYQIELINLFQRNSRARLYLKEIASGGESYIMINIQTRMIEGLRIGDVNHWVKLEPTDDSTQYILYTTKDLHIPEEKFTIDVVAGTSNRIQ